jgi:hypothetical protein
VFSALARLSLLSRLQFLTFHDFEVSPITLGVASYDRSNGVCGISDVWVLSEWLANSTSWEDLSGGIVPLEERASPNFELSRNILENTVSKIFL